MATLPLFTRLLRACGAASIVLGLSVGASACRSSTQASTAPQQPQPYPQQPYGQPYPQQPYGQPYPQQPPPQQPPPQPAAQRPLLAPLIGVAAQQQEVRNILAELINALSPQNQALVRGIPLTFDPTIEVNAFAGCDEQGTPFLAATTGILEAVDAIAQTKATDELFGTQTYEAYCNAVLPQLVKSDKARAALPSGIIPANLGPDPRRWSRAREIFDDVIAFTFGHELAHHYLGHTGCAKGQAMGSGPDPARLGRLLSVVPIFNQAGEAASDSAGCINALDAGRARRPQYEWSDTGGVLLLDYFARIERAGGGGGPLSLLNPVQFLRSHPNPLARIPIVQTVAQNWRARNPG
ncbi:MAG: hypothetical protein KIS78_13595 [Labilithrix sp.]|nr:hypothetical protein [Labilithrix sp.]MCW5833431.1 hypothetical protein [Labilithrix sp.]